MIIFGGTAEATIRSVLRELRGAATPGSVYMQEAFFAEAMLNLINLVVVIHRGDRADLSAFRREVGELVSLRHNRGNLGSYIAIGSGYADSAMVPGAYYEAALIRSAVQLLIDDYPPVADCLSDTSREMIDDIDEELLAAAEEVPAFSAGRVPDGLPRTHWWWSAPHGDPVLYETMHGGDVY